MSTRETLIRAMAGTVWALDRRKFEELLASAELLAAVERRRTAAAPGRAGAGRAVGVIHAHGPISFRPSVFSDLFGGSSVSDLIATVREFAADPNVGRIILDIDSPGGDAMGMTELAAVLRDVRRSTPISAVVNPTAASAGYWIASQADEILITPSGWAGSIGVFTIHEDMSRAFDKAGITPTMITSSDSPYKTEATAYSPLAKSARDELQREVDAFAGQFITDVALGRRVSPATVRSSFGKGRMLLATDAVKAGLADRIATLDQAIAGPGPAGRTRIAASLSDYRRRAIAHVSTR